MISLSQRPTRRSVSLLLGCGLLTPMVVSNFGCQQRASIGAVRPEGFENGGVAGIVAADKARRSGLRALQVLWVQRRTSDITSRVFPFLGSLSTTVRKRAIVMLGRLEDPRALKSLQAMGRQAPPLGLMDSDEMVTNSVYPELPLAIGRIQSRKLSGRRKLDVALSKVGLNFSGLISLSGRINSDKYGWMYIGNRVIEEGVNVLATEKRRGRNVDAFASSLTLRPGQNALLQAVSPSAAIESERLLDYLARAPIVGGDESLVTDNLFDLRLPPTVMLNKVKAKLDDRKRYPNPFGIVLVLEELVRQKDNRAIALLRVLSKEKGRPTVRGMAQSALNQMR